MTEMSPFDASHGTSCGWRRCGVGVMAIESRCFVKVPFEDGGWVDIEFERRRPGYWSIDISDRLIGAHPEAITATLAIAIREMRGGGK